MNWKAILKTVMNIGITFAGGYGAAVATGMTPKVALGAGIVAVLGNQSGLHQTAPAQS